MIRIDADVANVIGGPHLLHLLEWTVNKLPHTLLTGTFGELLVQLRLFQHSVQAAPPIKDSGNDLIAIRRSIIKAIQVKTTCDQFPIKFDLDDLPERYHILAVVQLPKKIVYDDLIDFDLSLDACHIFLLGKDQVVKGYWTEKELLPTELSEARIDVFFPDKDASIVIRRKSKNRQTALVGSDSSRVSQRNRRSQAARNPHGKH